MENKENIASDTKPAGYKVEKIILLESTFNRNIDIDFDSSSIEGDLKINTLSNEKRMDEKFAVTLTATYRGIQNDNEVCSAKIRMMGIFEKYGEPALEEDKFKAINAPAIIYPFVREYLYSTCLRAGLVNVLLPTVNFKP